MAWSLPSIATITVRGAMTADVRIFWKRSVVYDLCDRNLYVSFPLSLTHTHSLTQVGYSADSTTLKM